MSSALLDELSQSDFHLHHWLHSQLFASPSSSSSSSSSSLPPSNDEQSKVSAQNDKREETIVSHPLHQLWNHPSFASFHQRLSHLLTELTTTSNELHLRLDALSQSLIVHTPRALQDMNALQRKAEALRSYLQQSLTTTQAVDKAQHKSVGDLAELDRRKSSVMQTRALAYALREQRRVCVQVDAVISSEDIYQMAELLKQLKEEEQTEDQHDNQNVKKTETTSNISFAQTSLAHLITPRKELITRLADKIGEMSESAIASALAARDLVAFAALTDALASGERTMASLRENYVHSRLAEINEIVSVIEVTCWSDNKDEKAMEEHTQRALSSCTGAYIRMLDWLGNEGAWLRQAFPETHCDSIVIAVCEQAVRSVSERCSLLVGNFLQICTESSLHLDLLARGAQVCSRGFASQWLQQMGSSVKETLVLAKLSMSPWQLSSNDFKRRIDEFLVFKMKKWDVLDLSTFSRLSQTISSAALLADVRELTQRTMYFCTFCTSLVALSDTIAALDESLERWWLQCLLAMTNLSKRTDRDAHLDTDQLAGLSDLANLLGECYRLRNDMRTTLPSVIQFLTDETINTAVSLMPSVRSNNWQALLSDTNVPMLLLVQAMQDDSELFGQISTFCDTLRQPDAKVFTRFEKASKAVIDTCCQLIHECLAAPFDLRLRASSSWPSWHVASKEAQSKYVTLEERADGTEIELSLPQFSAQPSEPAVGIGELLLSLVNQIEPIERLQLDDFDATFFVAKLSSYICQQIVGIVEQLPALDSIILRQLIVDVEYLCNVFSAMSIEPCAALLRMQDALTSMTETEHHPSAGDPQTSMWIDTLSSKWVKPLPVSL